MIDFSKINTNLLYLLKLLMMNNLINIIFLITEFGIENNCERKSI